MAVDVGSAIGYLDLDISGFLDGLRTAQSEAGRAGDNIAIQMGEKITKAGQKIESAGKSLTTKVTVPIIGAGVAAVKTAADFESAMSQVGAISGATGSDLEALSEKAKEMGAKTKFSAKESAEAFQYMAMAGWKTQDMLDGIEGIMSLAAASGEDLATTSDIVTDALTAFGLTAADSAHFSDVLAAASSNANTNVSMMGETFKYAAPIAGALGYSIEDTAEAIGLMANSGIKGSQAGTTLRTIMTELSGEIKITGENLEDFTVQTTNSDGSMRDFGDILTDCREGFSQLSESEKTAAAEALVGKEAMSGFLALMNAAPADIEKLRGAIDGCDGTASKMADTMNDNLSGQLTILKSTIEALAISFGELMLPAIKGVVKFLQALVETINNLSDGQKSIVIGIALVIAAVGPILMIIGKLISGVGNMITMFGKIANVFGKFAGAASQAATPVAAAGRSTAKMAAAAKNLVAAGAGILMTAAGLALMAQSAIALAEAGPGAVGCMVLMVGAMVALGAGAIYMSKTTAAMRGLSKASMNFIAVGAAILIAAAGFAVLAHAAVEVSNAGWPAIAVMGGMVIAIAGLAAGAAALAPALTAGSVGLIAFGAAIALVGVGVLAATAGITLLATQFPTIAQYGGQAAGALAMLSGSLLLLGAGTLTAGAGLTVFGVGLVATGAGLAVVSVGAAAASVGVVALGAAVLVLAAGAITLGAGLTLCGSALTTMSQSGAVAAAGMAALGVSATAAFIPIAAGAVSCGALALALTALMIPLGALTIELATSAASCGLLATAMESVALSVTTIEGSAASAALSLQQMISSVDIVKVGLDGLGFAASTAVGQFVAAFTDGSVSAGAAATAMATAVTQGITTGLMPIPMVVTTTMTTMNAATTAGMVLMYSTVLTYTTMSSSTVNMGVAQMVASVTVGMAQVNSVVRTGFSSAVAYIKSLASQAYSWGAHMMQGLIRGINSQMGALSSAVNRAASIIRSNLHFSRPDEGPLRDYETWMPDFMQGLANGINSNLYRIEGAANNVASTLAIKPSTPKDDLFYASTVGELGEYNITLLNTLEIYRQLAEQMQLCSMYSMGFQSRDNGLLKMGEKDAPVPDADMPQKPATGTQEKPDQLVIPIYVGEEQLESVVVDLLRREVRT